MKAASFPLLAAFASSLVCGEETGIDDGVSLTVQVTGGKAHVGQAICSVFGTAEAYLKRPVATATAPVDAKGGAEFVFLGLAPGMYAVSVIHDADNNGELNTGFLGIPTERVAMSNNAKGRFGPPSFEKTRFELTTDLTIELKLDKAKQ